MTLSNDARDRVKHAFEPIALAMGRAGLTPDALTLIGFAITVIGAILVSQQLWLVGGLVVLVGGIFDMFDGTLARATGQVSKLGAFVDSVFDRAGEVIVYIGIVAGLEPTVDNGAVLAAGALGSSVMVSYTRAKSEGLGFTQGTGMAAVGMMPREVRLVILCVGLIAGGALGVGEIALQSHPTVMTTSTGATVISLALGVITIGATITTIQRILHVRSQALQQSSSQPSETNT